MESSKLLFRIRQLKKRIFSCIWVMRAHDKQIKTLASIGVNILVGVTGKG